MAIQVTETWLRALCGEPLEKLRPAQVYDVVEQFGGLAPWWLPRAVLEAAARHAEQLFGELSPVLAGHLRALPKLPESYGTCWAVLVKQQLEWLPLLRPARALPLQWEENSAHDGRLPQSLRTFADYVLATLRKSEKKTENLSGAWGLAPAPRGLLDGLDLSRLPGNYGSAWAPLAAGLMLASWQGQPDTTVWASGAWAQGQGVLPVNGLKDKLAVAAEFGARTFFVPQMQLEEARRFAAQLAEAQGSAAAGDTLEVAPLVSADPQPRIAFREYWSRLGVPPGPEAEQPLRAAYYLRLTDDDRARRYYIENILADVRQDLAAAAGSSQATHLVTIVSKAHGLVDLALGALRPTACLLLHDREMAADSAELQRRINAQGAAPDGKARCGEFRAEKHHDLVRELRSLIAQFSQDLPPERLVIDLTGGQRAMNLALYDAAPAGSYVVCFQAEFDKQTRRPKPFSERPDRWQVGRGG